MKDEDMAYIGRNPKCGCIRLAIVDDPERKQWVAKEVSKGISWGLVIERVTCQYVRDNMRRCPHETKKKEKKQKVLNL